MLILRLYTDFQFNIEQNWSEQSACAQEYMVESELLPQRRKIIYVGHWLVFKSSTSANYKSWKTK